MLTAFIVFTLWKNTESDNNPDSFPQRNQTSEAFSFGLLSDLYQLIKV